LEALAHSHIPHARLVGADVTGDVLGTAFIITEWIDGFSPKAPLPAGFDTQKNAHALAWELTDALAKIGNEDYITLGLENFGKPDGFLERQVGRWNAQLQRAHCRRLHGVDTLCDALTKNCPQSQRVALIHGDYQFINVMFAPAAPARLAAVIDWETATIGDPLLDLGWMLAGWQEPGEPPAHASYMDWAAMPTRAAVAERYAAATGMDVSRVDYYTALALFKLAAIMEGWYLQYLNGRSRVAEHAHLETMVPQMIDRALRFVGTR
jgi:aminoglycoside phosphotransferase (APT) family kinase protein